MMEFTVPLNSIKDFICIIASALHVFGDSFTLSPVLPMSSDHFLQEAVSRLSISAVRLCILLQTRKAVPGSISETWFSETVASSLDQGER